MSTPTKYRKKPVEIEAMQLTEASADEVQEWVVSTGQEVFAPEAGLVILTLEGDMLASWGDWIIRGVQGEFYPCKPDIFAESYEEVR